MKNSEKNQVQLFSPLREDPYFNQSDLNINLNSPFDRLKMDPSHVYDGLDVMNMS